MMTATANIMATTPTTRMITRDTMSNMTTVSSMEVKDTTTRRKCRQPLPNVALIEPAVTTTRMRPIPTTMMAGTTRAIRDTMMNTTTTNTMTKELRASKTKVNDRDDVVTTPRKTRRRSVISP